MNSIEEVTKTLVYFLKPGGSLLVVDLLKNENEESESTEVHSQDEHGHHNHHEDHHHHHHEHDHHQQHHGDNEGAKDSDQIDPNVVLIARKSHTVAHPGGFKEPHIRKTFEDAGLTSFVFDAAIRARHHGKDAILFIAKGTKPLE